VAGERLGNHEAVAREVVDLRGVERGVRVAGDRRVRDSENLGGDAAAVLHAFPDDQVGPPFRGDGQQVGHHALGRDVREGQDDPGGEVRPGGGIGGNTSQVD
jgi:hypothetical protein